jgi:hypothetical protein
MIGMEIINVIRLLDKGIIKVAMKLTDIEVGVTMHMCFGTDTLKQQDNDHIVVIIMHSV